MTALRNRINKLQKTVIIQTLFLFVLGTSLAVSLSFNFANAYTLDTEPTPENVSTVKYATTDMTKLVVDDNLPFIAMNAMLQPTKMAVVNSEMFPNLLATSKLVDNYLPPLYSENTNKALATADETTTVDNTSIDTPTEGAVSKVSIENNTEIQEQEIPIENTPEVEEVTNEPARPVFAETQITGNETIDIEILKQTVNEIAPSLSGIEDSMIQIYNETGIKPSFQLAKFCLESGYGTSDLAQYKNNIAGWNAYPSNGQTAYQHATTFSTLDDCVLTVGYGLSDNYISGGRTTIKSIADKYCPGNSSKWSSDVTWLMNHIEDTYSSLT